MAATALAALLFWNAESAWAQPATSPDTLTILAGGDVMLANWLTPILDEEGASYPFAHLGQLLNQADLRIFNLEAPFADGGTPFDKKFTFRVPTHHAAVLSAGGINAVNLANNHILDYGPTALRSTIRTLDSLHVLHFGAGQDAQCACRPTFARVKGTKIALLGYSLTFPKEFYARMDRPGTCYGHASRVGQAVRAAADSGAVVIVSFHWGTELRETPRRYQRDLAHVAIDAGASLVLGHHPHVLQGLELYKGKLIAYSLGNFVFASYSDRARDSGLLEITLAGTSVVAARFIPLDVWNRRVEFQPRVVQGRHARCILEHLDALSKPLNNGRSILTASGEIRLGVAKSAANQQVPQTVPVGTAER